MTTVNYGINFCYHNQLTGTTYSLKNRNKSYNTCNLFILYKFSEWNKWLVFLVTTKFHIVLKKFIIKFKLYNIQYERTLYKEYKSPRKIKEVEI